MNIFATLTTLVRRYEVVEERPFSQDCIDAVTKAEVVENVFGQSVCFTMISGHKTYMPIWSEQQGKYPKGTVVNMNVSSILTLEDKTFGYNPEDIGSKIYRVKIR